jgi:nucleoside-diphosphate-sugar epimerase
MGETILLTGATGMVGRAVAPVLASRDDVEEILALRHTTENPLRLAKIKPVVGDITREQLGVSSQDNPEILERVSTIVHAAANTQFSAPLDEARTANLEGTRNVLRLASRCPRLKAVTVLSTVHVAGRRTGSIDEDELEHTAGFVNAYEQSKYETELLLRACMGELPISVVRLSTVLGTSTTGEVQRPAAIHHALRLYYNSLAPMIPGVPESMVDLIALDYAAAAVAHFSTDGFEAGRTFQICGGEDTVTIGEMLQLTLQAFLDYRPSWRKRAIEMPAIVDLGTFELFVRSVEELGDTVLRSSVEMIKSFVPQLAYPKRFLATRSTESLGKARVQKPKVREFYPKVVRWLVQTGWGEHRPAARACEG